MPRNPLAHEGAPLTGALVASAGGTPEREHDAEGLYLHGPRRARPPLVRLIAETEHAPPGALTPAVARGQMDERRRRARRSLTAHQRFLAALRGERVPPVRPRRARA